MMPADRGSKTGRTMKLAFSGQARYTDFDRAYELYRKRSKKNECFDKTVYRRVIRKYCRMLADRLQEEGFVDLPNDMGTIAAVILTRKPQYRGKKFIGYGKMDWKTGRYDGNLKAFGIAYLPRHDKNDNLRAFGFVANRQLYKKMKAAWENGTCTWIPTQFNDDMI